jgi:dihydrofolate reductase
MRKLKLQVQISMDGFIAGANGEMDWLLMDWSDDLVAYVNALTEPVDTIVLGKNLAMGFIPHWAEVAADESHPEYTAGVKFTETPKIVFSKSIQAIEGKNTSVSNEDLSTVIQGLKQQEGGDIIAYGGGQFVGSLIKEQLIDELHLFVNPTIIGKGMPIFNQVEQTLHFNLVNVQSFVCGMLVSQYQAKKK